MQPHALRVAWEAEDAVAFADCFSHQGEFHSPVIEGAVGIRGRHAIAELMKVAFASTSEMEFLDEFEDAGRRVLRLRVKFNGRPVQGVLWLDLEADGHIRDLWFFVRPLTGVVAVSTVMGPGLARRENRALGAPTRVGMTPLIVLARLTDRIGAFLIRRLNREKPSP